MNLTALLVTSREFFTWVIALAGCVGLGWKYGVLPTRRFLKLVRTHIDQQAELSRSIGKNGKDTLFELTHKLRDAQIMHGSLRDVLDQPLFTLDHEGEVVTVNPTFRRLTKWAPEDLRRGGFRDKLDQITRVSWDYAIDNQAALDMAGFFQNALGVHMRITLVLSPVHDGDRCLGWQGSIDRFGDGEDDTFRAGTAVKNWAQ